jgi:Tfp pilus assembly protein PilF
MKKIIGLLAATLFSIVVFAQAPQKIKDRNGEIVVNSPIDMTISIVQGSAVGKTIFSEIHHVVTLADGSAVVIVGQGEAIGGNLEAINWDDNISFIKTEVPALGILKMSRVNRIPTEAPIANPTTTHKAAGTFTTTVIAKKVETTEVKTTLIQPKITTDTVIPTKTVETAQIIPTKPVINLNADTISKPAITKAEAIVTETIATPIEKTELLVDRKTIKKHEPKSEMVKTENYQKVLFSTLLKNINGLPFTEAPVVLKTSIIEGSTTGAVIYEETHTTKTDAKGLVTVEMGTGAKLSGDYTQVDWSKNNYFIRTETQPTGVIKLDKVDASTVVISTEKRGINNASAVLVAETQPTKVEVKPINLTPTIPVVNTVTPTDIVIAKTDTVIVVQKQIKPLPTVDSSKVVKVNQASIAVTPTKPAFDSASLTQCQAKLEAIKAITQDETPRIDSIIATPNHIELGNMAMEKEDFKKAENDYTKAIETDPKNAMSYLLRGNAKSALNENASAVVDYSKAIELDSTLSQAYFKRANAKAALRDTRGAAQDYNQTLLLDPMNKKAHYNLGVMQMRLKNYSEAIAYFDKATAIDASWSLPYYHKGVAKVNIGMLYTGCLDLSKAGELGFEPAYKAIKQKCDK